MQRDFRQIEWDAQVEDDCRQLVRLAMREDLERQQDWTSIALCPAESQATLAVVARQPGVISGQRAAQLVVEETAINAQWEELVADGNSVAAGETIARIQGSSRQLLSVERTLLNFLCRMSGVATMTARFVTAIQDANGSAQVYDTRKTAPGWRRLDKYAVGCGGGRNHRTGLFDAILIKDNHLCLAGGDDGRLAPGECVKRAKQFLAEQFEKGGRAKNMLIEIEVDTLDQLRDVLPAGPDIVLLDNMDLEQLRAGVALRNELQPSVQLEASGGVSLETVGAISQTGVERISSSQLTQGAHPLDIGLDWI